MNDLKIIYPGELAKKTEALPPVMPLAEWVKHVVFLSGERVCVYCGKWIAIHPSFWQKKYCGKICREKNNSEMDATAARQLREKINQRFPFLTQCKICGKKLCKNSNSHKYCSKGCVKKAAKKIRDAKLTAYKKTCLHCQKSFETTKKILKKYCSSSCRRAAVALRLKRPMRSKTCYICKTEFLTISWQAKYCSKECRKATAGARIRSKRSVYQKICPVCNKLFSTTNRVKIYHASQCYFKMQDLRRARAQSA